MTFTGLAMENDDGPNIEIDGEQLGLPSYKMGGISMANCECHNQVG